MSKKEPVWLKIIRILLACVFLYSSYAKAIDPVGFGIKMDEYFNSFGMGFMHPLSQFLAICAILCEFVLGCMMLFRVKVNLASWGYLLFMTFFFFLTMWLAIAEFLEVRGIHDFGVVKDCGCFGAEIKLSNWQTFLKNVIIIIPTIIVFAKRKLIPDIRLTELGKWLAIAVFAAIAICFQLHFLRHLPLKDHSDWKKGEYVVDSFIEKPAVKEVVFVYRNSKTGEEMTLSQDELMEQSDSFYTDYEYVDRHDSVITPYKAAKIPGFNMLDENGADHAYELISPDNEQYTYILYVSNLKEVNPKGVEKAKALAAKCAENDYPFVAVTNSSEEEITAFVTMYGLDFPIYQNPIDPVKGPFMVRDAVRSNPGLILFKKGVVLEKWAWRDFPSEAK
ncbi:MAG: DoxX family protein [Bacteroidales bacterium]|nr:DoxX family protein [Bacteroidales bacterium]